MDAIKIVRVITELKKIKEKGDVTIEDFRNIVKTIPDGEVRETLIEIADTNGSEEALKGVFYRLIQDSTSDDEQLADLLAILQTVL